MRSETIIAQIFCYRSYQQKTAAIIAHGFYHQTSNEEENTLTACACLKVAKIHKNDCKSLQFSLFILSKL